MSQRMTRTSCAIAFLLIASFAAAQSEFSGEVVTTTKDGKTVQAKMYFAKDKVRIEPEGQNNRGMGGVVIMNLTGQTVTVLMTQQHMYMEMPVQMAQQRNGYNFFSVHDVDDACGAWLEQAQNKGGTCHKVGNETVNGRNTVKYEGTDASGNTTTVWLDPKLRFPVKWQSKSGAGELRNIQEGTQSADLFEVPAGFTKMDMGGMGGMMQRPQ